ncbi:hypothetical protein PRO82_002001 [Candidatus Protochlamydia amoebophila]|nr:hypothetical protein [Candidatus Protochlamydia amoebophila]
MDCLYYHKIAYPVIIDRLIQHFDHLNPTVIKAPVARTTNL